MYNHSMVTPKLLYKLQQLLSLGLKPDSFALESVVARSLPGGRREGAPGTLVDVISDEGALDIKATNSLDVLVRKPKDTSSAIHLPEKNVWVRWSHLPLVIFRRPDFDHFAEEDAHRGIQVNVDRARDFYDKSVARHSVPEIRSLLVQHSFNPKRNYTVFRFSEGAFHLPAFHHAEKTKVGLTGFSESGEVLYCHNSFTKGSQNFSKVYETSDDDILVCIDHVEIEDRDVTWGDLNGIKLLS
jgi:hypothetical protein